MTKKADLGSKRLISLAPDNWVRWVTQQPDLQAEEILSSQFQWIERESDVLIKVLSPQFGEFIVLNELQLRYKANMPQRMRAYAALAEEKLNLPIYPVLINILPFGIPPTIPNCYQSDFMGIHAYQNYHVINLWEVEANLVFENNLSSLLPFVPILQGGGREPIVRRALEQLRDNQTLQDLEPLLSFFASFVLEMPVVLEIMRWDMTVLRESPWYNTILEQGLQEGWQKGHQKGQQEGRQEGRQEGESLLIIRQINKRFGPIDEAIQARIRRLTVSQLDELGESLLDFTTMTEAIAWLENNS